MKSIKPENFYDLRFIGNLNAISGKVYFEIFEPVRDSNNYKSGIYRLDGKKTVRYTSGPKDRDMISDGKGESAVYIAKNEKKSSIFLKNIKGGEERKLWETEREIRKIEWSKDSKGIYLITKEKDKEEGYTIIENYPIYFNGSGFLPSTKVELLYVDLSGKQKVLMKGNPEVTDIAVNPVKDELAVIVQPECYGIYKSKIGLLSLASLKISYLKVPKGSYYNPGYLEDGTLFFLRSLQEQSLFQSSKLAIWTGEKVKEVAAGEDISLENSVNSDSRMGKERSIRVNGNYVYIVATVKGRAGIYRVDLKEGKSFESVVAGDFSVDSFDFLGNDIYFIAQDSNTPQEVYRYDGNVETVTSINRKIENINLAKPENVNFKASDGKVVEGWYLKGSDRGTIMEVHGGPRSAYGEAFMFEFHLLNSLGFNVLFSNPRGSDGYGDKFALTIMKKYGDRDYKDLMESVEFAKKRYGIDEEKLGVIGGSYGGFMVNWIVGHTDKFKAAVSARSISDQVSFYFSSDIGPEFNGDQIGGSPYENLEHFWNKSPIKYMKKCKTPLLIVHSDEDYRCPVWQGYELFTQLKLQGNKVKMVLFKGENHELSRGGKPKNRVKRLQEISNWFVENINSEK